MISVKRLYPKPLKHPSSHLHSLVKGRLWLKVLVGLAPSFQRLFAHSRD
jgi:hypothetical protein